ncbi:ABC transporter substrate-binding protein [Oricola sp.]|uniref:ABC transporter substrate-binding protein n=1 Tax=Oricola sp. TaxID=1979950 RepID=UPI003BAA2F0D
MRLTPLRLMLLLALLIVALSPLRAAELVEPPSLAAQVKAGELPPMKERLPVNPRVLDFAGSGKEIGRYCCQLSTLLARSKDLRMITVYGYSRLVGFNHEFELVPDILESYTVEDDRVFTFKLREDHKWSDGHPLTAEDFRYYWEDVALNKTLYPSGPKPAFYSDGELPEFEVLDERTVRYTWRLPNPVFLPSLAGASPLYIYFPSHYLKQFHGDYADAAELDTLVAAERVNNWAGLHTRKARMYRAENPELPTLQPWFNTTEGPSDRFVFKRNPYYHRVDPAGQQLPYIDEVVVAIASSDLIAAKAGTGEADLQARYLRFDDYTFLKAQEKQHGYRVLLWKDGIGSRLTLYPNQNVKDPVWRAVFQDVRVRRALSLAIDRFELNQQLYFGLAMQSSNTVLPKSPLFRRDYADAWTVQDIDMANRLLDEAGLEERDRDGTRLLPDGRPMEIIVETYGEDTAETDALELIVDYWRQIGIDLFIRSSQRDVVRRRLVTGKTMMTLSKGLNLGLAVPQASPQELAPAAAVQPHWPVWGQHVETMGMAGMPPDVEPARTLLGLYRKWRLSGSDEERAEIWHDMLRINSDQAVTIGVATETLQPVLVSERLRNVPEKGIWAFLPTAYFGLYQPDTFWFEE